MSNDAPNAMIHAVSVVPMLAPMMTEMACASVSSPALTNETVITVVAVDDCTEAVTSVPVSMPVKRFVVMAPNTWRNCGPAIFCRASLMDFIPNMRSASEPSSLNSINIGKMFVSLKFAAKIQKKTQKRCFFPAFFLCFSSAGPIRLFSVLFFFNYCPVVFFVLKKKCNFANRLCLMSLL